MARSTPQALAERLFDTFLAPLVLGGTMVPGKPFGAAGALGIGEDVRPSAMDALSRTTLARVRTARRLVPIDTLRMEPSGDEWALAALLHDMVQATHPDFDAAFRRGGPRKLLGVCEETLERLAPPRSIGEALSRHTWFSRLFDITRTDVELRWWTGRQTFLGQEPPTRLKAWPELRRVQETRTPRPLMGLPGSAGTASEQTFAQTTAAFLRKTPLTDLATCVRTAPRFRWTEENLAFVASRGGRTLGLRALSLLPQNEVDGALGNASRHLFSRKATRALLVAIDVLRERALARASARVSRSVAGELEPLRVAGETESDDAAFAISAGATAAMHWLGQTGGAMGEAERHAMLRILAPPANTALGSEVQALLGA